jgi:hypothetical protein
MMDDGVTNSGPAQYPVKYSNFTTDDELLNLTDETDNAVPLIADLFHLKVKALSHSAHLN